MILSRFAPVTLLASVLFFASCNDSAEKTEADKVSSDTVTTVTAPEPAAVSTITTTPQTMLLVRHKVADFAKWKTSYEAHDSMRLANGLHNYVIGRAVGDSNMVIVSLKVDDLAKAKSFAKSQTLKDAMQKGGVKGPPTVAFVNAVYQDTAKLGTSIRSLTTFMVKDWAAWQKAFPEGKQERMDNGIIERVFGNDPDNNNKVSLVTALVDTAKARAYWSSDMLKKRREASGAIGVPERFIFNVVQRY